LERRSRFSRKRCKERAFYPIVPNKKQTFFETIYAPFPYLSNQKDVIQHILFNQNLHGLYLNPNINEFSKWIYLPHCINSPTGGH
ncbi:MAG: hypothetical protein ACPGSG_12100, partial [Prolixibacteraceae bacterium]